MWSLPSEHLPPSGFKTGSHSEVACSTVVLDFQTVVLPVVGFDLFGFTIEDPLLCSSVLYPSHDSSIAGTLGFKDSLHW